MGMADQIDRRFGLTTSVAVKAPVRVATTAALAALSGLLTVDGVALAAGNRVLVKDQASATANGIYVAATGVWARARDCDGSLDLVKGTLIHVVEGSANGGGWFECTSSNPVVVTSSSLSFSRLTINYVVRDSQVAAEGQTIVNVGTAYQVGANSIALYINGLRQRVGADFTETSSTRITMTYALAAGDEIDCYIGQSIGNLTAAQASLVGLTDAGDFYIGATVEAVLQEIADAITIDNGDASIVLTYGASTKIQRWNTPLTANRTATLSTNNAKEGASFVIVRTGSATGNFTLTVGALITLRAPGEWCEVGYDAGTGAWMLLKHGYLPASGDIGMSADNGNADAILTIGSSSTVQRWATPFTAERTATLSTAVAWSGAEFTIVRTEAATGAFSLSVLVGATRLVRLAPGQWCTVKCTGSSWIVTGFGDARPGLSSLVDFRDDFVGLLPSLVWQTHRGTDASIDEPKIVAAQARGIMRMVTGADAGGTMVLNGVQLEADLNWRADQGGLAWEARVALSAITNVALFIGLTDQVAALEMPFTLAAGDVLTSNASDAVGVLFDTGADTDNWWLVGVKADIDAAKQNTGVAPAAGTFETWRVELDAIGQASFYREGVLVGVLMLSAVTPSTALTPVIAAFSRAAASRNVDVDEVRVQAQR